MNKRIGIILGVFLAIGIVAVFVFIPNRTTDTDSQGNIQSPVLVRSKVAGFTVLRHPKLQEMTVEASDQKKGQLWALAQPANTSPVFSITAVYTEDKTLKKLAAVTDKPLPAAVLDNVTKQLRKQYGEHKFNQVSQRVYEINDYSAAEVIFDYESAARAVRQRLVLVFKDNVSVVYIRGQAETAHYQSIADTYFTPLINSAKFE